MTNRFTINSAHQSFTDKQKTLFDFLENAEQSAPKLQHNQQMEVDEPKQSPSQEDKRRERKECESRTPRNPRMKQYKSRESIFKRPEAPLARCLPHGRIPGFRKNPNQWTKYTLDDVKDEDMSDRSNTQAAFSFLRSLEKNKSGPDHEEKLDTLPEKIVFKKSSMIKKKQVLEEEMVKEDDEKSSFRSSKVVMPEYVVGQSKKEKKKRSKILGGNDGEKSRVQLKLDHLDEEDE